VIDAPIDHIALVVADLERRSRLYTQTLGFSFVYRETVTDQGIEAVGLRSGDSIIELLRPLDEASPIAAFRGSAATKLHHTAYRVDDIAAELARAATAGVRLIDEVRARRPRQHHRLSASEIDRRRADRTLPALVTVRRRALAFAGVAFSLQLWVTTSLPAGVRAQTAPDPDQIFRSARKAGR